MTTNQLYPDNVFIDNKYLYCYRRIIKNALSQVRKKGNGTYYENHHIIPKSICPEFKTSKWNKVLLTAKEHYICHHLLIKCISTGKNKMISAFWRMTHSNQHAQRITAKVFDNLKKEFSTIRSEESLGPKNHFYNKSHTKKTCDIMSLKAKGRIPWNKGKTGLQKAWNKDLTKDSNDSVKKISESKLGNKNPMFGNSGIKHHNTRTVKLHDHLGNIVGIFYSKKELKEFCSENKFPFNGLYKTRLSNLTYSDNSKTKKYISFTGWWVSFASLT